MARMAPTRRQALTGIGAVALAPLLPSASVARAPVPPAPLDVTIRSFPINAFAPLNPGETRFGAFEFRGGLELQSDYRGFGGISSLRTDPTGTRLTAITDAGQWLTARLVRENGRPSGLSEARMAAILGPGGRPLAETGNGDCEALWIEGGVALVGIERTHRIARFETFGRDGVNARATLAPVPMGAERLRSNRGIEAIGIFPRGHALAGTVLAISENSQNAQGDIRGFLIGRERSSEFAVKRTNDFEVTDLAFLPSGELLLLERWFSPWRGVAMRIRRIDAATIQPGAVVDGPIVLAGNMANQIDNMEGIAVHRGPDGETMIMLISDDNFSYLQRTILLQFALSP